MEFQYGRLEFIYFLYGMAIDPVLICIRRDSPPPHPTPKRRDSPQLRNAVCIVMQLHFRDGSIVCWGNQAGVG